jgi:hypothetical protein
VPVKVFFGILDAEKRPDDGEEAEPVEEEVAGHAEDGHGVSAQRWAKDARGVELRGVEGDGVGEVFALHELWHEGLVAGRVHGHRHARAEGYCGDSPHRNVLEECQAGEQERQQHHDGLRDEEQAALVDAVCDHSAEEGYEEERNLPGEADDAEPERGVGERDHQPALGDILHPGADVRGEVPCPEEAEIWVAQGADDLRQLSYFRFWKGLNDSRGLVGRGGEVLFVELGAGRQGELRKLV